MKSTTAKPFLFEPPTWTMSEFLANNDLNQTAATLEALATQIREWSCKKRVLIDLYHKESSKNAPDELSKVRDMQAALEILELLRPYGFAYADTVLNKPLENPQATRDQYWRDVVSEAELVILPCRMPIGVSSGHERVQRSNSWLEQQIICAIESEFLDQSSRDAIALSSKANNGAPAWETYRFASFRQIGIGIGQLHALADATPPPKNATLGYVLYTPMVSDECPIALLNVFGLKGNDSMMLARLLRRDFADMIRDLVTAKEKHIVVFQLTAKDVKQPGYLETSSCFSEPAKAWQAEIVYNAAVTMQ